MGLAPSEAVPAGDWAALTQAFPRLWQGVRWENEYKETFWRLTVDGVPLLGNSHLRGARAVPCRCGFVPAAGCASPRLHHFWFCPVAQAVLQQLESRIADSVTRVHVWLVQAPPGVTQCVWDVVSLATVSAMERGRRHLVTRRRQGQSDEEILAGAVLCAVADFWASLRHFALLGVPRRGWTQVGALHPFLRVVEGRLVCAGPASELVGPGVLPADDE